MGGLTLTALAAVGGAPALGQRIRGWRTQEVVDGGLSHCPDQPPRDRCAQGSA
ncbi:MAG: hypothetical protein IPG54_13970 [Sphingomonadales bacterium]|nr:hypothetical protein [Sphingomonadales bacterium]